MGLEIIILLFAIAFAVICAVLRFGLPRIDLPRVSMPRNGIGQANRIGWLPASCFAVLLVGSVFGHDFFNLKLGPLPITLDRVLLGALVLAFAWQCLIFREQLRSLNGVDIAVVIWLVVITVSALTHDFSILGNLPLSRLLFFNWLPVTLYFVIRWCRLNTRDLVLISVGMVVFGGYLAFTAIAETRGLSAFVFPSYIVESAEREFLGRGRGPFLNPVVNGIVLTVSVCCTLMWWPRANVSGRIAVGAFAVLCAFGVYSTFTRSTWVGLAAGMLLFVFWPSKRRYQGAMLVAGTVALIILVPVIGEKIFSFKRDRDVTLAEMQQSARLRPLFASVAIDMFQDRPLLGVGFAQYAEKKFPYLKNPHSNLPLRLTQPFMQHNVFLAYLVDTGLIGLGALLFLLGQFYRVSWRLWSNRSLHLLPRQFGLANLVLLVTYCINGLFHDVSIVPMLHMFLFFWIGVVNNVYSLPESFQSQSAQLSPEPAPVPETRSMAA